jgi:imidazolonepropionase-like amidohydrolase
LPKLGRHRREIVSLLSTIALASACWSHGRRQAIAATRTGASTPTYQLANGRWYDGAGFVAKSMWTMNGRFVTHAPAQVDSVIDLSGQFVVPPFAEAHTHNIGCPPSAAEAKPYLRDGILYVMVQGKTFPPRADTASRDTGIDVTCAGALLTPSGSHITLIDQRSADRGNFPGLSRADLDGGPHVIVDSREDLDRKLGPILSAHPPFIKIILAFSEEWEKRRTDTAFVGKRGLDPSLVPVIVGRAHDAGVKVSAHIETAADFRVALAGGVDFIAHLPGLRIGAAAGFTDSDTSRWLLTDADGRAVASRGVVVITTSVAARPLLSPPGHANPSRESVRAIYRHNIAALRAQGARLAIGSDLYAGNSLVEALMLGRAPLLDAGIEPLGVFDNGELLRLWSVDTPRAIFPGRRIGSLEDDYEASFLTLAGDPVADFGNVRRIILRMKNGRLIQ